MNKKDSKISIIVPVYNVENYLEHCIKSILKQSYKSFELILVNDGSTDNSSDILNKYKLIDSRINVIEQHNMGLSAARNTGIKAASGKYLTFIDSDDWISRDYIKTMNDMSQKYDADIVSIKHCTVDENSNFNYIKRKKRIFNDQAADALFGFFDTNYAWGKLIRKEILIKNNIFFPIGRNYEDIGTMYKIYDKSKIVVLADQANYFYRVRKNSITYSRTKKDVEDKLSFLKEMKKYHLSHKYSFWDLYVLVKAFGTLADVYKIPNIDNEQKKDFIKKIYASCVNCNFKINFFKAEDGIDRAFLMKLKIAHKFLSIKYRRK